MSDWPDGAVAGDCCCWFGRRESAGGLGAGGLGKGQRDALLLKLLDSGIAALGMRDPEQRHELGYTFVEPGVGGAEPGVGERVNKRLGDGAGIQRAHVSDKEGVIFEGLAFVIEDGQ